MRNRGEKGRGREGETEGGGKEEGRDGGKEEKEERLYMSYYMARRK